MAAVAATIVLGGCADGPSPSSASAADQHTSSRDRLTAIARGLASGKPIVTAQAVRSTKARADRVWSGDITVERNDVWLVQVSVSRTIVCVRCTAPAGARSPTGRVATEIVDAASFRVSAYGLGSRRNDLRRLGPVLTLHP